MIQISHEEAEALIGYVLGEGSSKEEVLAVAAAERLNERLKAPSELGHDKLTREILDNLQEAVNHACKPGRQFRGAVLVLVDEKYDAARFLDVPGPAMPSMIGYLEYVKHAIIVSGDE